MSIELGLLKWAAIGTLTAAWLTLLLSIIVDRRSMAHRYWSLYVAYLDRKLRSMFIQTSGRRIAVGQVLAVSAALALRLGTGSTSYLLAIVVALVGPALYIEHLRRARLKSIEAAMDSFILGLANALKSTPSIGSALSYCQSLLHGPLEEEVVLTLKEMRVGSGLDEALLNMAGRVQSLSLDATFSSILIWRKVGGDLAKILETTASTLREMSRLQGVVRSKTAEGKAQLGLLVMLPLGVLFLFDAVSDGYFAPLTRSVAGYTVIFVSIGLWAFSIILARKVLSVEL